MKTHLLCFLVFGLNCSLLGQGDILQIIENGLEREPSVIHVHNPIIWDTLGGHLQGIQSYRNADYLILSGSSHQRAYLSVVHRSSQPEVLHHLSLMEAPYKHAGGFQICDDFLAVGIEDNEARNLSKVMIYRVSDFIKGQISIVQQIDRQGAYQRATAGCVGLAFFQSRWIIMVGDWDTKHLDIYENETALMQGDFSLVQSITIEEQARSNWSDPEWLPYQNINLFVHDQVLYLAAFTSDRKNRNLLDLFLIEREQGLYQIKKIDRQTLENTGCDFVWAAGLVVEDDEIKGVISSPRNLVEHNVFHHYPIKK